MDIKEVFGVGGRDKKGLLETVPGDEVSDVMHSFRGNNLISCQGTDLVLSFLEMGGASRAVVHESIIEALSC